VATLRGTLEKHYRDMYDLALELDSHVVGEHTVSLDSETDRRLLALRQHLTRSPLWINFPKWNRTIEGIEELEAVVEKRLVTVLSKDDQLKAIDTNGRESIVVGLATALTFQIKSWSQGGPGLYIDTDIHIERLGGDRRTVRYGAFHVSPPQEQTVDSYVGVVRVLIETYEPKIRQWEQYEEMKRLFSQLNSLKRRLRDELAIIIMRRIVPGRCKYCPL
jgi:hypothetical protein